MPFEPVSLGLSATSSGAGSTGSATPQIFAIGLPVCYDDGANDKVTVFTYSDGSQRAFLASDGSLVDVSAGIPSAWQVVPSHVRDAQIISGIVDADELTADLGVGQAFHFHTASEVTLSSTQSINPFVNSDLTIGTTTLVIPAAIQGWMIRSASGSISVAYATNLDTELTQLSLPQSQVETLVHDTTAVESVSYSSSNSTDIGGLEIHRRYIGDGNASISIYGEAPNIGDEAVTFSLPTGYLSEYHMGSVDRNELNVSAHIQISSGDVVDQFIINRDDNIDGEHPFNIEVHGIGKWVGDEPAAIPVISDAIEVDDQTASGSITIGTELTQRGVGTVGVPIVFLTEYDAAPNVQITANSSADRIISCDGLATTTGFSAISWNTGANTASTGESFYWEAVGLKA